MPNLGSDTAAVYGVCKTQWIPRETRFFFFFTLFPIFPRSRVSLNALRRLTKMKLHTTRRFRVRRKPIGRNRRESDKNKRKLGRSRLNVERRKKKRIISLIFSRRIVVQRFVVKLFRRLCTTHTIIFETVVSLSNVYCVVDFPSVSPFDRRKM